MTIKFTCLFLNKMTWKLEDGWNKVHTSEALPTIDSIKFLASIEKNNGFKIYLFSLFKILFKSTILFSVYISLSLFLI